MKYRGIARTIPPGGYKNFRLGWVWGGVRAIPLYVAITSSKRRNNRATIARIELLGRGRLSKDFVSGCA
eukprot:scaffold7006_cov174-Skeletonema_marinoi.AAC.35